MSNDPSTNLPSSFRPARLALSLPDCGESGLIDARALRAEPLHPSLTPTRPPPVGPPRTATTRMGAAWAALTTAVAASAMLVVVALAIDPAPTVVVQHQPTPSGHLALRDRAPDGGELATHAEPRRATRATSSAVVDAKPVSEPVAEAEPEPAPDVEATASPSPRPPKTRTRSTTTKTTVTKVKAETKPKAEIPVECVLDPSKCDASGKLVARAPSATTTAKPRPDKLSAQQLKQALAATKADARRCGPEHGADTGTSVQVKLSIEGSTGSVVSATAQGEFAGTSLGRCVATALSRTEFPPFAAAQMGTLYTVRI